MNRVSLIGRVVRDFELRQTQGGTSTCQFAIAVERPFKDKDGKRQADYPNCVAWRQVAEIAAKYLRKGDRVGIDGALQTRSYEDKNGNKVYATEVVVDRIDFLQPRGQQSTTESGPVQTGNVTDDGFVEVTDDALPF